MASYLRSRLVLAFLFAVVSNVMITCAVSAQDVITVGTATADGPTVDVPVSIRDRSGTPLGMDQVTTSRIQAFSIRVTYAPAAAVSSVTFTRAGITASLHPAFETSPASSGAISLLASFQQSTNPIPFTLNASAPGDLVAHLVFQLSSSATPGQNITLTLDSATTQLTDDGGSAATKETTGNGQLTLVNGSIVLPVPAISLTPPTQNVTAGSNGSLFAQTDVRMINNTSVQVTSSNTAFATVQSPIAINAGSRTGSITVTGISPGTVTITATLPASAGGGTATATVKIVEAAQCVVPSAPPLTGPETVLVGTTYNITWPAVGSATDYVIEESTDSAFGTVTSQTVVAPTAAFTHTSADVRYYYRVRARNHTTSCDTTSANSSSISVLITALPTPPVTRVLPAVGSAPGNNGAYFKTSVQLYNAKSSTISGKIVFHPAGAQGSSGDPSLAYTISSGKTLSFDDLLPAMGVAVGLGSADLVSDVNSSLPVTLARVFNDGGVAGTSGIALEPLSTDEALKAGNTGAVIAPADFQKFRLNIGVRTLEQGVAFNVIVRNRDGVVVKTLTKSFSPTFFTQSGSTDFLEGLALAGGETITFEVTSGSAFIYGSTTDNVTNDPSVQFARRIE
ncbi:MAG: hypothetical protein DMF56_12300 [Acidobacteria bacterium]|nr:MAG: hypothetical protein DMF56_12300 [Acidobacteriota bacterium]